MAGEALKRELVEDKLTIWQQRLELLHWEIRLELGLELEAEGSALAEIVCHPQYDRAELRLGPGWDSWDPADIGDLHLTIDYILAHELVHAHMRDLDRLVLDDLDGLAHRDAIAMLVESYHRGRERLVDRLARALVDGWGPAQ